MSERLLIVGLGNPGEKYARTRHNAGFMLVDRLAERWSVDWAEEKRCLARMAKAEREGQKVLLAKPQTYMNLSGDAVRAIADYYKIPREAILVSVDDADLPVGRLRLKAQSRSGGHHGLESIENRLGSNAFARQKIGIGRRQDGVRQIRGHVLGVFSAEETTLLEKTLARAADQAECWMRSGTEKAMNEYNGAVEL